ncbi:type II secretion system minor pseudopilin GspK [Maricaulis salignorans]|uniref:type II secretion system minor pseudopilin GspK n=1 Tax=Maricaulis salignorans TaxID=144026 RepID=UPI003A910EE6
MIGRPDKQAGAALITAILLVALMSSLALAMTSGMRFSLRQAANMEVRDQAHWYVLGARDYAEALLLRALDDPSQAFRPDAGWLNTPRVFPIEGGQITGEIRDAHNCFNPNALVTADAQARLAINADQQRQFERLLRETGIPAGQAVQIAAATADWLDSDLRPVTSGAEDDIYLRDGRAYRTGNTYLSEAGELRAVAGVTTDAYSRVAPLICAFPGAVPLALDINTLRLDQAPLLMAALNGALTRAEAETVLLQRPAAGYADIEAFWATDIMRALELDAAERPELGVSSRYFEIDITVQYAGIRYALREQIEVSGGRQITRVTQRHGMFL